MLNNSAAIIPVILSVAATTLNRRPVEKTNIDKFMGALYTDFFFFFFFFCLLVTNMKLEYKTPQQFLPNYETIFVLVVGGGVFLGS